METEPPADTPRSPHETDLITLCRALNAHGVRYIVVGGMAIIRRGFLRATEGIDLLLESSAENITQLRQALEVLPDKAIREMAADDLYHYAVVRVADEIIVDLMVKTCGIDYTEAAPAISWHDVEGVRIPFASASLLWRMKQTGREKDALDLLFLQEKLRQERG